MTSTQLIDPDTSENSDVLHGWDDLSERTGPIALFGSLPWSMVKDIPFIGDCAIGAPKYVVPIGWVAAGAAKRLSSRTLEIVDRTGVTISPSTAAGQSLRRSLVGLALPKPAVKGYRRVKPYTWVTQAGRLRRIAQWVLTHRPNPNSLWSHLDSRDWALLRHDLAASAHELRVLDLQIRNLIRLGQLGFLSDYPISDPHALSISEFGSIEISPKERSIARRPKVSEKTFVPFSDDFVSDFINKCIWFQNNVADQLIECWSSLLSIEAETVRGGPAYNEALIATRRKYIANFDWRDAEGKVLDQLPWAITTWKDDKSAKSSAWPPDSYKGIRMAIAMLQGMNFCLMAFCTGARHSELMSGRSNSLDVENQKFIAKTFKTERNVEGRLREWPLHPVAARALQLQEKLASVLRPGNLDHLWVKLHAASMDVGTDIEQMNEPIKNAIESAGASHLLDDSRPHPHRWRHTIARLVALSVTDAPHVLQDLFGHKNLEMTFRYMLSDPEITREAEQVANEEIEAMAVEAIQDSLEGRAGGPAATRLQAGLEALGMRRGEERYDVGSLQKLADIFTFTKTEWELVRPGVICTKTIGEAGPCTQGRGAPDPGACRTTCDHRLETAGAHDRCRQTLEALLQEYDKARVAELEMLAANLRGKILANLERWDDIRDQMFQKYPEAAVIWKERKVAQ